LTTSQQSTTEHFGQQPTALRNNMASHRTNSNNTTTKKAASPNLASRRAFTSSSPIKHTVLQDWLLPEQPCTMKVTPGKLLTNEEMESRVPTLAHMVGQANAHAKGKSNKQQVPCGIPD
jgi:hypothetical protein